MEKSVFVEGEIDVGTFKKFKNDVGNTSGLKKLTVNINSNGGYVTEGMDIYHYLNNLKGQGVEICTVAWGMCASIAVAIFLAGKERMIHEHTKFLIHLPTAYCEGNKSDMLRQAQRLESIENNILDLYVKVTNSNKQILYNEMAKDTFMPTQKVLEYKFATTIKKVADNARNEVFNKPILKLEMEKNYKSLAELNLADRLALLHPSSTKGKVLAKRAKRSLKDFESNLTIPTDKGESLYVYTDDEILEGKLVVLANADGSPTVIPAPNGKHIVIVSDNKFEIEVLDGVITKVTPLEADKVETNTETVPPTEAKEEAKKDEETMKELNKLKTEFETLKTERNALSERLQKIETLLSNTSGEKNSNNIVPNNQPNPNRFYGK